MPALSVRFSAAQVAIQKPGTSTRKQYKYDKVFGPESNQEQVYEDTKALIRSVLDGRLKRHPAMQVFVHVPHIVLHCKFE